MAVAIILSVAAVVAYGYFYRVDRPNLDGRFLLHNQIIDGTAGSPYLYRVLVPFFCALVTRLLSAFMLPSRAFLVAYGIYDFAAIAFLLGTLFAYMRRWFSWELSLIGVLFVAGTLPVALADHYFQPWSILEVGLFAAGLLAIVRERHLVLALIVLLSALNKETAVLIPLAFLVTGFGANAGGARVGPLGIEPARVARFVGYVALWLAVFVGLRLLRGNAPQIHTIREILAMNTSSYKLTMTVLRGGLLFGFFWVFAALGLSRAPGFLRKTALVVPFYIATVIIWGIWAEVRLLMPLYAILVPLGLVFVDGRRQRGPERLEAP